MTSFEDLGEVDGIEESVVTHGDEVGSPYARQYLDESFRVDVKISVTMSVQQNV